MVTTVTSDRVYDYRGLSSDTKPGVDQPGVGNGSIFYEMDTTDVYLFSQTEGAEEAPYGEWIKQ